MTISSRDKKLLIVFGGILLLVLVFFFVYRPTMEKNDVLVQENEVLQTRLWDLQAKEAMKDDYLQETDRMTKEINQLIASFPSYLMYENEIMDAVALEGGEDVSISALTISDPVMIPVVAADSTSVDGTATTDTTDGTATDGTATDGTATDGTTVTSNLSNQYALYDVNSAITYESSYAGLKKMIAQIADAKDRKSITTLTATFDEETGELNGSISFEAYFVMGQDKEYVPADIPSVSHGTNNIFGTID